MTKRIALLTTLIVSLVLLPGCPGVNPLVGTWVFNVQGVNRTVILSADGMALSTDFEGLLTWGVDGSEFRMGQFQSDDSRFAWTGRVNSESNGMSGWWIIWEGGAAEGMCDSWTAAKQ